MIALLVCFLFPVPVSIREDGFLHLNRGTFFVLAAFFLTGMAQASGMGDPALGAAVFKKANRAIKLATRRKTVWARN